MKLLPHHVFSFLHPIRIEVIFTHAADLLVKVKNYNHDAIYSHENSRAIDYFIVTCPIEMVQLIIKQDESRKCHSYKNKKN